MLQNNSGSGNSSNNSDNTNSVDIPHILRNLPIEQLQRFLRYIEARRNGTNPLPNTSTPSVFSPPYGYGASSLNTNIGPVNTSHNASSFIPTGPLTGNENIPPPGTFDPSLINRFNPANVPFDILNNKPNIHAGSGPPSGDAFNDASSQRQRPRFSQFPVPSSSAVVPPRDVPFPQYNRDTWQRMNGNAYPNPYINDYPPGHNNVFLPPIQNHQREVRTSLPGPQQLLNLTPPPQPPPSNLNPNTFQPDFSAPTTLGQQWQMSMPNHPNEAPRHQIRLPPPITYVGNNNAFAAGYWATVAEMSSPAPPAPAASQAPSLNSMSSNMSYLYSTPPSSSSNSATMMGQRPYHHHAHQSVFIAQQDNTNNPGGLLTKIDNYDGTPSSPTTSTIQTFPVGLLNAPISSSTGAGGSSSAHCKDGRSLKAKPRSSFTGFSKPKSKSKSKPKPKYKRRKQQLLPAPELFECLGPTKWCCKYNGPDEPDGCKNVSTTARNLTRHMRVHARGEVEMGVPEELRVAYNGLPDELRWIRVSCPLDDDDLLGCGYYRENGYRWETSTLHRPEYLVKKHVKFYHDNVESA